MDVLVTGGAGFIGSSLIRSLAASNHDVRAFDDLSTGSLDNLRDLDGLAVITGDVRDLDSVRRAVEGVEVVYHLAALPSVARSVADPLTTHAVNVNGTLNILVASRDAGVRRVVYASSSSVYGDTPTLPKHERMPPSPLSPYAASKLAGEVYCRAFANVYELETVSLRFFNVFGPGQDPASQYAAVIPRFITRMLIGEPPEIYGDGHQSRDFTFVQNAIQACTLAASARSDAVGESFNIGCGGRTTLLDLVEAINELLNVSIRPSFSAPRPGDIPHSHADIAKAERFLGYRPTVSVRAGLSQTIDWYAARQPATRPGP
jgi:UDP-N-acetylglucosamine/UDP-N-acetyl-alpha-D-glucosaminouronate 4-epimerase